MEFKMVPAWFPSRRTRPGIAIGGCGDKTTSSTSAAITSTGTVATGDGETGPGGTGPDRGKDALTQYEPGRTSRASNVPAAALYGTGFGKIPPRNWSRRIMLTAAPWGAAPVAGSTTRPRMRYVACGARRISM